MAELRSGGQIDSGSVPEHFQITNGHLGEQLPCLLLLRLQLGDLFFRDLFQLSLELGTVRVGGKQVQTLLFGRNCQVVLPTGGVAICEAVLRVCRRRVGFDIQLEELDRIIGGLYDLDTPGAMALVFDTVRRANSLLDDGDALRGDVFAGAYLRAGNAVTEIEPVRLVARDALAHLREGVSELMCHPGHPDDELRRVSDYVDDREREVQILCDPDVPAWLDRYGIELIGFDRI